MRVLVVGTSPPPGGAAARALANVANNRREAGDEVEILSPDPVSAAHRTARLDGLFLAGEIALLARRFDAIELRIETGVPCRPTTSRSARAAYLLALGLALRGYGEVTLRLDSPVPIPGGVGGRATTALWSAVSQVVVGSTDDFEQVCRVPGMDPTRVVIESPLGLDGAVDRPWPEATEPDLRRLVLDVVRQRSDADRRAAAAHELVGASTESGPSHYSPGPVEVARLVMQAAARRFVRLVRS